MEFFEFSIQFAAPILLIILATFRIFIVNFYSFSLLRTFGEYIFLVASIFYIVMSGIFSKIFSTTRHILWGPVEVGIGNYRELLFQVFHETNWLPFLVLIAVILWLHIQNLRSLDLIMRRDFQRIRDCRNIAVPIQLVVFNIWALPALILERFLFKRRYRNFDSIIEGSEYIQNENDGLFILRLLILFLDLRRRFKVRKFGTEPRYYIHPKLPIRRSLLNIARLNYGSPGSGKTNQIWNHDIKQIMDLGERMIIYDFKGDFCEALGDRVDCLIVSPFDERGPAWSVGRDVNNTQLFLEMMWAIVGSSMSISRKAFFDTAFVDIAAGVYRSLNQEFGESWGFKDLYAAMHDIPEIRDALSEHRPEASMFISGSDKGDQTSGVWGTIREKMIHFEALARAWPNEPGGRGFSLQEFLSDGYQGEKTILILRVHPQYPKLSQDFLAIFIQLLVNFVSALPDKVGGRHINLVIDELQTLGRIPGFLEFPRISRSKGLHVIFGTQDFAKTNELYRDVGGVQGLLNSVGLKLVGRSEDEDSKKQALAMMSTNRIARYRYEVNGRGEHAYSKSIVDSTPLVSGSFSLPAPSLTEPAYFFLKFSDWPIIKLAYKIVPMPKISSSLVAAKWLSDEDIKKQTSQGDSPSAKLKKLGKYTREEEENS